MAEPVRNRHSTVDLDDEDVRAAVERMAGRHFDRGHDRAACLRHLDVGRGRQPDRSGWRPAMAVVKKLPTKYMTDEPGYMTRLAAVAAELFDELGLGAYAEEYTRSQVTAGVHAAFDRSRDDGARGHAQGVRVVGDRPRPISTRSGVGGQVMGTEEAMASRAAAEGRVGGGDRRWRARRRWPGLAGTSAGGDRAGSRQRPSESRGQTWRTAVVTERIGAWVDAASMRSADTRSTSGAPEQAAAASDPPATRRGRADGAADVAAGGVR